jgi:DNA polymerase-3 subunit delta'
MRTDIVLHPRTKTDVAQFVEEPRHALALVGAHGMGKTYVAESIAAALLGLSPERLNDYPYLLRVEPEKGSISIEKVRELVHFLQLKTIGRDGIRRVVIVEHAEGLTTEAQNAFLKALEEPPADTMILLTVNNLQVVLPTIRSRVQTITVHLPEAAETQSFFGAQSPEPITQAYFLSGGMPGLLHALIEQDQEHPLLAAVTQAKALLQQSTFERLAAVETLSKQKESAFNVLQALLRIAQTGLSQATKKSDTARIKQWHHVIKGVQAALDALNLSANPKLVLSTMMLQL